MFYVETDDKIICYKVIIDERKLKEVRFKIIWGCSLITNKIKERTTSSFSDIERYIIYSKKEVDRIDRFYYDSIVYEIVYEELIHPLIITKIDKILKGNYNELMNLFNNNSLKEVKLEEFKIKKQIIIDKLSEITPNSDKYVLNNLKDELGKLENRYTFKNMLTVSEVCEFYDKLCECISLEKVKEISKDIYMEVVEFMSEMLLKCPNSFPKENSDIKRLIKIKGE